MLGYAQDWHHYSLSGFMPGATEMIGASGIFICAAGQYFLAQVGSKHHAHAHEFQNGLAKRQLEDSRGKELEVAGIDGIP